jgi:hypothetical protein
MLFLPAPTSDGVASCRQPIIFSSDDSGSLHLVVCYILSVAGQFGGKDGKTDLEVGGLFRTIAICQWKSEKGWLSFLPTYT